MSDLELMPYFTALLLCSTAVIEEVPRAIYQISQASGDNLPQISESALIVLTFAGLGYGIGKIATYRFGSGKPEKPYENFLGIV